MRKGRRECEGEGLRKGRSKCKNLKAQRDHEFLLKCGLPRLQLLLRNAPQPFFIPLPSFSSCQSITLYFALHVACLFWQQGKAKEKVEWQSWRRARGRDRGRELWRVLASLGFGLNRKSQEMQLLADLAVSYPNEDRKRGRGEFQEKPQGCARIR